MTDLNLTSESVIKFWFEELQPADWWRKDQSLDRKISDRFGVVHSAACIGELYGWRTTALGRLAEIIVLDQFSRNMYRDSPRAFAQDALALALAQEAVWGGFDGEVGAEKRGFFYMPYMHSESKLIHSRSIELFTKLGLEGNLKAANRHKEIIDRFGRYPHRNVILSRTSTPEEELFLQEPNSGF